MLTKFETRSNRVKGVAFHNKRPWVICGLHNGTVQIWDYRMGTPIDRYEEHEGPVRGVDFHVTQPLFVTGADDYKIKVWNHKLRRCITTFLGHLDYIRMVQFHREQPWIVSASDDQTIRIWNWQSRSSVSVLTGHNHYVMCAQFHPREDLIVSACLDLQIRVWDFSGLKAKRYGESGMSLPQDLFGSADVTVKYVLEGHEKGVNWAAFHPTKPLIVSGADDRSIRIWKMDDTRTYEIEQLRGHTNNVCCVTYFKDLIVSASEDRTIRVWDANMRSAVQTFRRESDRFWVLAAHPDANLLAAGHDTGLQVFKLERERPAWTIKGNLLHFVKERSLHTYDFDAKTQAVTTTLRRHNFPPHTLSCNPNDQSAVLWYDYDGGVFELFTIPKRGTVADSEVKKGFYTCAVFFGGDKFAVLDKTRQIVFRNASNDITKVVQGTTLAGLDRLFPAPQGNLILRSDNAVALYHVAQKMIVAEAAIPAVKYVVWSTDFSKVALLAKHTLTICGRKLNVISTVHESSRIKSAIFDEEREVLYYATSNHLKYTILRSGESATLFTLDSPIYLVKAKSDTVWYITREGQVVEKAVDNTELSFKMALQQERFRDVIKYIKAKKMQGQALVAYLHKHGYPQIAMHFVSDPVIRFNLALECGVLDIAKSTAMELNNPACWRKLAETAVKFGDIQLGQLANAKTGNFNGLGLQCVLTGDMNALSQVIAKSSDTSFKAQYSLFTGDPMPRMAALEAADQLPLAFTVAVSNGLAEEAARLLGKMDPEVAQRCQQYAVQPAPQSTPPTPETGNWPLLTVQESYVTRMLREPGAFEYAAEEPGLRAAPAERTAAWGEDDDLGLDEGEEKQPGWAEAKDDEDAAPKAGGGGWGDDDDLGLDDVPATTSAKETGGPKAVGFVVPREGESIAKHWIDHSTVPAHHIAAGSFNSAMQLLRKQVGLKDVQPLQPYFMAIWAAANGAMPTLTGLPTHIYPSAVPTSGIDFQGQHTPRLPSATAVFDEKIASGYRAFADGRFEDAVRIFQSVLHTALLHVVSSKDELLKLRKARETASEYVQAVNVEILRKQTPPEQATLLLELAAYFTHFNLQPSHLALALSQAMVNHFKAKNRKAAGAFARRYIDHDPPQEKAERARKVIAQCDAENTDTVKIEYDDRNPFKICCVTKRPMYRGRGEDPIKCAYCFAPAQPKFRGQRCPVCLVSELGNTEASGCVNVVHVYL